MFAKILRACLVGVLLNLRQVSRQGRQVARHVDFFVGSRIFKLTYEVAIVLMLFNRGILGRYLGR